MKTDREHMLGLIQQMFLYLLKNHRQISWMNEGHEEMCFQVQQEECKNLLLSLLLVFIAHPAQGAASPTHLSEQAVSLILDEVSTEWASFPQATFSACRTVA